MLLYKNGQRITIDDVTYEVGMKIAAASDTEYSGLNGTITEIRTESDMDTENEGPDIYCCFSPPDDPKAVAELERVFSGLYGEQKSIDEICLDCVIMAPCMIAPITDAIEQKQEPVKDAQLAAEILKFTFGFMERNNRR